MTQASNQKLNLPAPQPRYDLTQMTSWKRQLEQADQANFKKDSDCWVGNGRVILKAPNGNYYAITVSNTGVLSTTQVNP